jgi:hypothetical protein
MTGASKQAVAAVLALIAEGASVRSACERTGLPRSTFLGKVDPDAYAQAREACADAHFDELLELERQMLEGELAPPAFKALFDARKWRLARMRPSAYGDKTSVEHSGSIDLARAINEGRSRAGITE